MYRASKGVLGRVVKILVQFIQRFWSIKWKLEMKFNSVNLLFYYTIVKHLRDCAQFFHERQIHREFMVRKY